MNKGVLLLIILLLLIQHQVHGVLPRRKGNVDIAVLVTHHPGFLGAVLFLLPLQMTLEDGSDAVDLLDVAFNSGGDRLGMVPLEPDGLAKVGALAGGLEVEPLAGVVEVGSARGEAELVLLVVGLGQVLEDGAGLPQGEVGVGVVDGGQAAVGVDVFDKVGPLGFAYLDHVQV